MTIQVEPGQLVTIDNSFRAGFLLLEEPGKKEYALFDVQPDARPIFVRLCTRQEKKALAKLVYGERSVRSSSLHMDNGETCLLFIAR